MKQIVAVYQVVCDPDDGVFHAKILNSNNNIK